MSDVPVVGKRIRHFRKLRGLTQGDLGAPFGYGHSTIAKIESGDRRVYTNELVGFAAALDVSPMDLLLEEGQFDPYQAGRRSAFAEVRTALRGVPDLKS